MTAKVTEELAKGLPYFEKSYSVLDAKANALPEAEKAIYHNDMVVLKQIYAMNGDTAKRAQIEAALSKWK